MTGGATLVLVVEDEVPMRRFLRATLTSNGYRVIEAATLAEAVQLATSQHPDLVLLDLGLPDGDGLDFTRRLRGWSRTPIVVLSARGREADKVEALDAGADDYVMKPFGTDELLARMRVALRHAHAATGSVEEKIVIGEIVVDFPRREVKVRDAVVHLTPIEFKLLAILVRNAGKVLTHRHILTEVWGASYANQAHYVRVHMAELRKKIERDPARPRLLVTEQGVGYRLRAPV